MNVLRSAEAGQVGLRVALPAEAGAVSELALRSKAHWGYDAAFLEACRDELTYTAADCRSGRLVVAERAGRLAGFYLLGECAPEGELMALFVDPPSIGTGLGRILMEAAMQHARHLGCAALTLDADPGAESFYARFGFRRIGTSASGSIPGRQLPRMRIELGAADVRPGPEQAKGLTAPS